MGNVFLDTRETIKEVDTNVIKVLEETERDEVWKTKKGRGVTEEKKRIEKRKKASTKETLGWDL